MLRELVEEAADDVPEGMTAERVAAEKNHVERQHQRADAHAELHATRAVVPPECLPHVMREKDQEQQRDVHEVAMDVLENQRERPLAEIRLARLTDGAVRR